MMETDLEWVSIFTVTILPGISLLRRCGNFDCKDTSFSLDRKTTAGTSWTFMIGLVKKNNLFYNKFQDEKEISGSDDEAIAFCLQVDVFPWNLILKWLKTKFYPGMNWKEYS